MVHAVWTGAAFLQFFALCLAALQVLLMALGAFEEGSDAPSKGTGRDLPGTA